MYMFKRNTLQCFLGYTCTATHTATYTATHTATYTATHTATHTATYTATHTATVCCACSYGVATISRLLKIIGLFRRISSLL